MRKLLPLFAILVITACKKDQVPVPAEPASPTKWDVLPGQYKVYDTLGTYLYDMQINHAIGQNEFGYRVDSLIFVNFDGNFTVAATQNSNKPYSNDISLGTHFEIHDLVDNRWNIFDYGCDAYDVFNNDSILFKFRKWNTPYWMNDGTTYFDGIVKQIAVKQH